jgi:hypothetical protein
MSSTQPAQHLSTFTRTVTCCRLLLKTFDGGQHHQGRRLPIGELGKQAPAVRATFDAFAEAMTRDGFAFLRDRMAAGDVTGPSWSPSTPAAWSGRSAPWRSCPTRGPLPGCCRSTSACCARPAAAATAGRCGARPCTGATPNGAAYQLLQTELGGPSERICLSEGLSTLGFVTTA